MRPMFVRARCEEEVVVETGQRIIIVVVVSVDTGFYDVIISLRVVTEATNMTVTLADFVEAKWRHVVSGGLGTRVPARYCGTAAAAAAAAPR